jgi:hypothetical protein
MLTTLIHIFGFASIDDGTDFELLEKIKMTTTLIVGGDCIDSQSPAYLNLYLPH